MREGGRDGHRDRSAFLSALDQAIVRLTREGFGRADSQAI
jgi:hypothetical protein